MVISVLLNAHKGLVHCGYGTGGLWDCEFHLLSASVIIVLHVILCQAGQIHNRQCINTLRPRQNGRHFPDAIFQYNFLNEKVLILIFFCSINNITALV